jgi:hypothetical protein
VAHKSRPDPAERAAELAEMLDELEQALERLKVMYEQYFMGIQKIAPMTLHRSVERKFLELTQAQIRNTGLRFRLSTLTQKFGVYNTYWRRTMRKIEAGTYVRDIARVTRKAEQRGGDLPEEILAAMPKRMRERILKERDRVATRAAARGEGASAGDEAAPASDDAATVRTARSHVHHVDMSDLEDLDFDAMFEALTDDSPTTPAAKPPPPAPRPAPTPPAPAARAAPSSVRAPPSPAGKPPPPVPTSRAATTRPPPRRPSGADLPPGVSESQARDLYKKYVQARKLVGEQGNVSYDRLVRTLSSQAPRIMQQHDAKAVEFNVVIKDDKVVLKAKPVKGSKE